MINLIIVMTIWGSIGVVMLWSGFSAIEASFFRCIFGALILLPYCWFKGDFSTQRYPLKQIALVSLGGIFITLNWVLIFQSFIWASITLGNVSYYLQPVFLVLLGILFFHESVSRKRWGYILLTVIGVVLTIDISPTNLNIDKYKLLGILCALGAGLLYAFATIIAKKVQQIPASLITLIQLGVGCLMLYPFVNLDAINPTVSFFKYALILGVIHTAIAYILYYKAVKVISITNIAILGYIDPIVAILTDVVFFDRALNELQIAGILLTMVGSYLVVKTASDKKAKKAL